MLNIFQLFRDLFVKILNPRTKNHKSATIRDIASSKHVFIL